MAATELTKELKGQARLGAERRASIVDAAIEVFAQRGFRGGALADVAELVGMTPAGILYHFGSKEALLAEVIAERDRRAGEQMVDLPIEGGLASLRGIVRFAEACEREPGLATLHTVLQVESFEPDHPAHAYFRRRSRILQRWMEETLQAAQQAGEVRADLDCASKGREIVAFLEGAAVVWLVDPKVSLVDLYTDYLASLEAAIGVAS
ncbi:MAG: hypothetical protein QOE63_935 [Acidimicrobiaceae bacterium]|jgi:AcrR family transcriptional regulator